MSQEEAPDYQSDVEDNNYDENHGQAATAASFKDFMLIEELLRAVEEAGFEKPSPVQNACINLAVNGRDILCQAQAGTGKTAVFVLSILNQLKKEKPEPFQVLVISPTRELATQIKDEFKKFCKYLPFQTKAFFGGATSTEIQKKEIKQTPPHIIVGCPGRLLDLVQQKALDLSKIKYFVVDECDKVFSELQTRKKVQEIFIRTNKEKQVMMFSGTLPQEIRETCKKFLQNPEEIIVEDTAKLVLNGLHQYQKQIEEKKKMGELVRLLESLEYNQAMIFVNSHDRAEALSKFLESKSLENIYIHGRLQQELRNNSYDAFKSQNKRILVATDLFGRGMDFPRVNLVINFDMPIKGRDQTYDNEQYMHRVGRAGRHFTKGNAISFITSDQDKEQIKKISECFSCKIPELPDQIEN